MILNLLNNIYEYDTLVSPDLEVSVRHTDSDEWRVLGTCNRVFADLFKGKFFNLRCEEFVVEDENLVDINPLHIRLREQDGKSYESFIEPKSHVTTTMSFDEISQSLKFKGMI